MLRAASFDEFAKTVVLHAREEFAMLMSEPLQLHSSSSAKASVCPAKVHPTTRNVLAAEMILQLRDEERHSVNEQSRSSTDTGPPGVD